MTPGHFSIARLPRIEFGVGVLARLPGIMVQYGTRALIVTGAHSFVETPHWATLLDALGAAGIGIEHCCVDGEPSPQLVDAIVADHAGAHIDVVVGIGGGSALDAAKAIAGLLRVSGSVMDYLEGVGPEMPYEGPAVPFIAVPTTAGTGSEATKNAVLSVQGEHGFKKSFRDDRLVAEYAVVDPTLLASCPPAVIAANGMDALTQLLESYLSLRANPFTDALAMSGLESVRDALIAWHDYGDKAGNAHAHMAYAALNSGITLAQCGLGSVHGLASPLGAFYPIPHGVVCGTLVGACTEVNIDAMLAREPGNPALNKYVDVAHLLCQRRFESREAAWAGLIELLASWTDHMKLPRLSAYGLSEDGLDHVVANARGSSMKTNPIVLTDAEVRRCLEMRL